MQVRRRCRRTRARASVSGHVVRCPPLKEIFLFSFVHSFVRSYVRYRDNINSRLV